MNKELEALENIRQKLARHYGIEDIYKWSAIEDDLEIIEKSLKALEIIKEKRVDLTTLYFCFEKYDLKAFNNALNYAIGEKPLTQEEYDLLKEVLL